MEEETEINNNDLNNNTDFDEERLEADQMADMAHMPPRDRMQATQSMLLRDAHEVRQRIHYKVTIEQIYHQLEVVVDNPQRVQMVTEDLQARIDNGEFDEASNQSIHQEVVAVDSGPTGSPAIELNDSLVYVPDDDSGDEADEVNEPRTRLGKRKKEAEQQQQQEAVLLNEFVDPELEERMEREIAQLAILLPERSRGEMRQMYLDLYDFEKENTINILSQQIFDAQESSPTKRPRVERNEGDAGPSSEPPQLQHMLACLPHMSKDELRRKAEELNWNEDSINHFVIKKLRLSDDNAGPSEPEPAPARPVSPQPGTSHEAELEEVVEEPVDDPGITDRVAQAMLLLPEADPEWLRHKVVEAGEDPVNFHAFINTYIDSKEYPSMADYEKRVEEEGKIKMFTQRMSIPDFLKHFPSPKEHFESWSGGERDLHYQKHAMAYLKEHYSKLSVRDITRAFRDNNFNLTNTFHALKNMPAKRRSVRSKYESRRPEGQHLHFYQEITYIERQTEIEDHFKSIELARAEALRLAKERNELLNCGICYDDECLFEDMTACAEGHLFCKECVRRHANVLIGDNQNRFPCLDQGEDGKSPCQSEFPLQVLKPLLEAKKFACLARRLQSEEIRAANLPGLETCPSCEYSYIPDENSPIFECQEETCRKVTCRKCQGPNHLPLRCEEVEKDDEVQARLEVEEKMTNAMVRECPKCKEKFIKTDGCNKIRCLKCSALSCYVCRKEIDSYSHFNQGHPGTTVNGPDGRPLCPLYSTNEELHIQNVQAAGERAKRELAEKGKTLKHDPTKVKPELLPAGQADNDRRQRNQMLAAALQGRRDLAERIAVGLRAAPEELAMLRRMNMQRNLQRHLREHDILGRDYGLAVLDDLQNFRERIRGPQEPPLPPTFEELRRRIEKLAKTDRPTKHEYEAVKRLVRNLGATCDNPDIVARITRRFEEVVQGHHLLRAPDLEHRLAQEQQRNEALDLARRSLYRQQMRLVEQMQRLPQPYPQAQHFPQANLQPRPLGQLPPPARDMYAPADPTRAHDLQLPPYWIPPIAGNQRMPPLYTAQMQKQRMEALRARVNAYFDRTRGQQQQAQQQQAQQQQAGDNKQKKTVTFVIGADGKVRATGAHQHPQQQQQQQMLQQQNNNLREAVSRLVHRPEQARPAQVAPKSAVKNSTTQTGPSIQKAHGARGPRPSQAREGSSKTSAGSSRDQQGSSRDQPGTSREANRPDGEEEAATQTNDDMDGDLSPESDDYVSHFDFNDDD